MQNTIAVLAVLLAAGAALVRSQYVFRRSTVRAALANKMDPNFWPSRGRRAVTSEPSQTCHVGNVRRQTTDEDGPFWANRGRSLSELNQLLSNIDKDEPPFWANRGRSVTEGGPSPTSKGRSIPDEGPFWANRGRSVADEGPFWANRGRSLKEEGPFWANRDNEESIARRLTKNGVSLKQEVNDGITTNRNRRVKDNEDLQRETLYVEEPGWIYFSPDTHTNVRRNPLPDMDFVTDTFYGTRGKKDVTQGNNIFSLPLTDHMDVIWAVKRKRDNRVLKAIEKVKEANFWASRGKKFMQRPRRQHN